MRLSFLVDLYIRKAGSSRPYKDVELEGWERICYAIQASEFVNGGKSRVLSVFAPGRSVRWFQAKDLDFYGIPDAYNFLRWCWVPTHLAVPWLGYFGIFLPEHLLPWSHSADATKGASTEPLARKKAPGSLIDAEVERTYKQAKEVGSKPPNIKEIADIVWSTLDGAGYTATKSAIRKIAEQEKYRAMRLRVGQRPAK